MLALYNSYIKKRLIKYLLSRQTTNTFQSHHELKLCVCVCVCVCVTPKSPSQSDYQVKILLVLQFKHQNRGGSKHQNRGGSSVSVRDAAASAGGSCGEASAALSGGPAGDRSAEGPLAQLRPGPHTPWTAGPGSAPAFSQRSWQPVGTHGLQNGERGGGRQRDPLVIGGRDLHVTATHLLYWPGPPSPPPHPLPGYRAGKLQNQTTWSRLTPHHPAEELQMCSY